MALEERIVDDGYTTVSLPGKVKLTNSEKKRADELFEKIMKEVK